MHIGQRIASLRERENISQNSLAKSIGATRAAVNAWEMELSKPNAQSLQDLSLYFHVTVDYLMGLDDHELISLEQLSPEEKQIILRLIHHFEYMKKTLKDAE